MEQAVPKKKTISVNIPQKMLSRIKEMAIEEEMKLSEFIVHILRQSLKETEAVENSNKESGGDHE